MADPALVLDGSALRLSGPVTLHTVTPLMTQARRLLARNPDVATFDLSGVSRIDSAGVALLVEVLRLRERAGGRLEFASLPEDLQPFLQLYSLEPVFGLSPRA